MITVKTRGYVSITGVPVLYIGKFAIQKTDWGFLWLDTETQEAGHVQVQSRCGVGLPPSATGLYVIGDCNGITDVLASSGGSVVIARQLSGQGGACRTGCSSDS